MSAVGLSALQRALYARLVGDAALTAGITGVFDHVPEKTAPPYVRLGEGTEVPFDTFDRRGHEASVTLEVWSEAAGFREALEIADRVVALLTETPLAIDGHQLVSCELDTVSTLTDPDGRTRLVPITLRVRHQDVP